MICRESMPEPLLWSSGGWTAARLESWPALRESRLCLPLFQGAQAQLLTERARRAAGLAARRHGAGRRHCKQNSEQQHVRTLSGARFRHANMLERHAEAIRYLCSPGGQRDTWTAWLITKVIFNGRQTKSGDKSDHSDMGD